MNKILKTFTFFCLSILMLYTSLQAASLGTAFTYQGRLSDNGQFAQGIYDFQFRIYNAEISGNQIGSTLTREDIPVNQGLFTIQDLDFGSNIFTGEERWLEIGVRPGGSTGVFTIFSPLQPLTTTPYAIYALNTQALRVEPHVESPTLIGGYSGNYVTGGVYGAFIGGGGTASALNFVTDNFGTIGGGGFNQAGDGAGSIQDKSHATVSGGFYNLAGGQYAAVGGGFDNAATGNNATVGGGDGNSATSSFATVGGGYNNRATGIYSAVTGGESNSAASYSFAAGRGGKATHVSSFVWGGGGAPTENTNSWGDYTFTARAHGGVRFYSASGTGSGVQLSAGSTIWGALSDRRAKENFQDVDSIRILQTLTTLPISSWNLKSQSREKRHIGPVAQDFNMMFDYLFGELESPVHINTMDVIGVSLASIQGLYRLFNKRNDTICSLEKENFALTQEISILKDKVQKLESFFNRIEQTLNGIHSPLAKRDR